MKASIRIKASMLFYRIAAVVLLLFAAGHTLGFRQSDPEWGVDALLGSMRSIHFDVQGFNRTYWDLFVAAGFSVGVFYLFAAILAWQLGGLPAATLAGMRGTAWAFALSFAAITVVSWRYLFIVPIAFSIVITLCLTAAADTAQRNIRPIECACIRLNLLSTVKVYTRRHRGQALWVVVQFEPTRQDSGVRCRDLWRQECKHLCIIESLQFFCYFSR